MKLSKDLLIAALAETGNPYRYRSSMESVGVELEHAFYGKLKDPSVLEEMGYVHQLQWDVRLKVNDIEGTIRVRNIDDGNHFVLCIKRSEVGNSNRTEWESSCTEDTFNAIQSLAISGMCKKRYCFAVEGSKLVWELDVFEDLDGNPTGWVKLDLEVESADQEIPPFPVEFETLIDPKDKDGIRKLLDDEIVLKGPMSATPSEE